MVTLHLLNHMDRLSDEAACAHYLEKPYVQAFWGETHFQHALPLDRSSMMRRPIRRDLIELGQRNLDGHGSDNLLGSLQNRRKSCRTDTIVI